MLIAKTVSSLEKIFLKDDITKIKNIKNINAFKGERISFQIILRTDNYQKYKLKHSIQSEIKNINMYKVGYVPSECPVYEQKLDEHYLKTEPGLFPDVLYPIQNNDEINIYEYTNTTIWVTIDIPREIRKGKYDVKILLEDKINNINNNVEVQLNICNYELPESDLTYTQWFHTDCIASYYNIEVFSEKHWELIDNFMKKAVRTGINTILTPIITPPLDTEIGAERHTVQLVDIEKNNDKYEFKYDNLEKWVNMAKRNGIKNFEMAHLATQWGAEATPKIVIKENGKLIKKFGWNVSSKSKEYKEFLEAFLPSLIKELKKLEIDKNTYFHISDEPSRKRENDFKNYIDVKNIIEKYLKDFEIIDALSDIEYYKAGIIKTPIVATNKIEPFLNENIEKRWCYYCCSQAKDVSNRFMAMPSYRTRILGIQLYMNDIIGFLHWGFNFYYSQFSKELIDPFKTTDAKQAFPSGDPFSVYPYKDGAIESIRSVIFYEGLQDRMSLKLLEQKIGKQKAKEFVNSQAKENITFSNYPHCQEFIINLKDKIIQILENQ